jgi:hypothetical protein
MQKVRVDGAIDMDRLHDRLTDWMMTDLCIPANSTGFIIAISEKLAVTEPSLTLEFLNECFVGFNKSSEPLRHLCLDYMAPWLPNLSIFARNSPEDGKQTLTKTKEVIRLLIDLTVTRNDVSLFSTLFADKSL